MRNGILGSMAAVLASAGLIFAQSAPAPESPTADQAGEAAQSAESKPSPPTSFLERLTSPFTTDYLVNELGGTTQRFKAGAEAVLWFPKETRPISHIASVGTLTGDLFVGGSLENGLDYKVFGGARFWLDYEFAPCYGADWNLFTLGSKSLHFRDDTSPILLRPFFNFNTRSESSLVVAFPGLAAGSLMADTSSQVWGTEAYLWRNLVPHTVVSAVRIDALVGLRYVDLSEDLNIGSLSTFNRDVSGFPQFASFAANSILTFDNFQTHSQFLGGEIGAISKFWMESIVFDVQTKLAIGTTFEDLNISGGQSRTNVFGRTTVSNAGLLALPSNIGHHSKEKFAVLAEVSANVHVPLGQHLSFFAGYNLIFWDRVLRVGEQIDRALDVSQIPNFPTPTPSTGQLRPTPLFVQSDFWLQGVNVGVEFSW
jgi:hypothetical protein